MLMHQSRNICMWGHYTAAAAAAKSLQLCLTLCDSIDSSPPGSPVPGILQARTLEWVAIAFSNAWKWKVKVKSLSHAQLLATPWTAAYQAPPSMGFSRQGYWSGVPLPSPYTVGAAGNSCRLLAYRHIDSNLCLCLHVAFSVVRFCAYVQNFPFLINTQSLN